MIDQSMKAECQSDCKQVWEDTEFSEKRMRVWVDDWVNSNKHIQCKHKWKFSESDPKS